MPDPFIPETHLVERLADQMEQSRTLHKMELQMFPFNDEVPPLADWLAASLVTSPEFQDIISSAQERQRDESRQLRQAFQSMLAFSPRDWGQVEEDAWLYGVVFGWGGDPDVADDAGAWQEIADRFNWDEERLSRVKRLHSLFQQQ